MIQPLRCFFLQRVNLKQYASCKNKTTTRYLVYSRQYIVDSRINKEI